MRLRLGLRSGPRCGSLLGFPDPLAGGEGARSSLPKNLTPALAFRPFGPRAERSNCSHLTKRPLELTFNSVRKIRSGHKSSLHHLTLSFWLYKHSHFAAQMGVTAMRTFSHALSKSYCNQLSAKNRAGKFTNSYSTGIFRSRKYMVSYIYLYFILSSKNRQNDPYSNAH